MKRSYQLRAVLLLICGSMGMLIYHCLPTYSPSTRLLCSQHEVAYSRPQAPGTFSVTDEYKLKYSKLLQDILRSYQYYHSVKRRELAAGKSSKTMTWFCISSCNGIGDRVKGMYAAFLLALVTNRTFFIHLNDEVHKTMFLEPSAIDWRPVHSCVELPNNQTLDSFGRPSLVLRKTFGAKNNFSLDLNRLHRQNNLYISGKKRIFDLIRDIINSEVSTDLSMPMHQLLKSVIGSGGSGLHSFLSVLHQFLFNLSQQIIKMTNFKLSELNLKPKGFVTVHIRTGFKNTKAGEILLSKNFLWGLRFAQTKQSWRDMLNCAISVSDSKFGENSTVLIVSDDWEPKIWAASNYRSRVTMLDVQPVHVSSKLGLLRTKSGNQYLDTWVELSVMSQSSAIVGIQSGYSEIASHMTHIELYTYELSQRSCAYFK